MRMRLERVDAEKMIAKMGDLNWQRTFYPLGVTRYSHGGDVLDVARRLDCKLYYYHVCKLIRKK